MVLIYWSEWDVVPTSYRESSEFPLQVSDINTKLLAMLENQISALII